jgi:PPOX class probable F420-dependent enzyme
MYVIVVSLLAGVGTSVAGVWCLVAPRSFAELVDFPYNEHFLHDLGAFQLGLGLALMLAVVWTDALATTTAGFLAANTAHAVNHVTDLDLGGNAAQAWLIAAVSVAVAVALWVRLRQLGFVVGRVGIATTPALAPFVRQKTARITTYRRDGRPGSTPISIAVDGDRAFLRSYAKSIKTRRLRRNPSVEISPSTMRGRPTGPAIHGSMRLLSGAEDRYASRVLVRKHPFLHGILVPLAHRVGRSKTGRTVHFELVSGGGGRG